MPFDTDADKYTFGRDHDMRERAPQKRPPDNIDTTLRTCFGEICCKLDNSIGELAKQVCSIGHLTRLFEYEKTDALLIRLRNEGAGLSSSRQQVGEGFQ